MRDVNSLVICKEDYDSAEQFENAIKDAIMVILNNGYIGVVKYDEKQLGIVSIEYEHDNLQYGTKYPYFLSPEEYESIIWDEEATQITCDKESE